MLGHPLPLDRSTASALALTAAGAIGALMLYAAYSIFFYSAPIDVASGSDPSVDR
jgi:hypothetical protein